jgi:hypothetical protein
MQRTQDGSSSHQETEKKRKANEQFDGTDHISKKHCIRQYDVCEHSTVKVHGRDLDVTIQILLEAAVGKTRIEDFVLTEKKKKHRRRDANGGNRLSCRSFGFEIGSHPDS